MVKTKIFTRRQKIILGVILVTFTFLGWLIPNLVMDALFGGRTF